MGGFVVPALCVVVGVCLSAALHHVLIGFGRKGEGKHVAFAVTCVATAGYDVASAWAYKAGSEASYIAALKVQIATSHLFWLPFLWFVALSTGLRPMRIILGLIVLHLGALALGLVLPQSYLIAELDAITERVLPWGEQITHPDSTVSAWITFPLVVLALDLAFVAAACRHQRRRGESRSAFTLALGLAVFLAAVLHDSLYDLLRPARAPILLSEYGFLALVVLMSFDLSRRLAHQDEELRAANDALRREFRERLRTENEKASLQEQLHQSQKLQAIGQLASGVAHDFNNLLTVISAHTDRVRRSASISSEVAASIAEVEDAVKQAAQLSRSLLDFGRRMRSEKRRIDLGDVVARAASMLRRLLPASIAIEVDVPAEPVHVRADETQIQQLVLNLALNARDAMPAGGRIEISVEPVEANVKEPGDARHARLRIQDSGHGMAPEVLERVFTPFFTTKAPGGGTGIGLAVVKSIVENHGGEIDVESRPGAGATFTVTLEREPADSGP